MNDSGNECEWESGSAFFISGKGLFNLEENNSFFFVGIKPEWLLLRYAMGKWRERIFEAEKKFYFDADYGVYFGCWETVVGCEFRRILTEKTSRIFLTGSLLVILINY